MELLDLLEQMWTVVTEGRKDDGRAGGEVKDRWDLLPIGPMRWVVKVLTHGAIKYADDNWTTVRDARRRYYSAAMRHVTSWYQGQRFDTDSGLPSLAHAIVCLIFLLWFEENPPRGNT